MTRHDKLKIWVSIPHQRRARVQVATQVEMVEEYDTIDNWRDDLSAGHVFGSWREAFAWANNRTGHQAAAIVSEMRAVFQIV